MSLNRYARQRVIRTLDMVLPPSKRPYRMLVENVIPNPQRNVEETIDIIRHVGVKSQIIHLEVAWTTCNGECGALEEHSMGGVRDYMLLYTDPEDSLSTAGHLPLLAGLAKDGSSMFVAQSWATQEIVYAVTEGTRPKDLKYMFHYTDGYTQKDDLYARKGMAVLCLRHDPFVSENSTSPSIDSSGIDPTGPYSWRFSRTLTVDRSGSEKVYLEGSDPLWVEVIHEPISEQAAY